MVNNKEFEAVNNLEPFDRYLYAIKKIADSENLFGIKKEDNEWALSDLEESVLFTIWSSEDYLKPCLVGDWEGNKSILISLNEFETVILPYLEKNNYLIEVFPIPNKTGFIVDVEEFWRDLSEELENYN